MGVRNNSFVTESTKVVHEIIYSWLVYDLHIIDLKHEIANLRFWERLERKKRTNASESFY